MAVPDTSIDPRIIRTAKEEFLKKGFLNASLETICKNAGVTTGALYNRYRNKEALFNSIVSPTLEDLDLLCARQRKRCFDYLDAGHLAQMWNEAEDVSFMWLDYIYDRYDGFRLLLCCSEKTRHSNFLDDFVSQNTDVTYEFSKAVYEKGYSSKLVDKEVLHLLLTAYWSARFEVVKHGFPKEKAKGFYKELVKFFNWNAVLGY